ncbi:MAG: hypothetical protein A3A43_01095 [Candidatus Liptonbacteria bacterium RIFCSPLOWO2_01_FULL_56_20]|uniref:Uncharacterized protein n=1 Tax=Candidatus Liptonbacteria bacterium RIFCSPLOWO2_01_FULL_56_20 TaxID=1798652 RepID=A0A1G2CJ01_9BACT|nr:MAG: hypothetical protein A3A43_01095 [Candidatus Liptonbacteria bacterium RIFCSPLOWO2_01_FULL_56_20]
MRIFLFGLSSPGFLGVVHAQTGGGNGTGGGGPTGGGPGIGSAINLINPLACGNAVCVVEAILAAAFWISVPIVSIMVLWGGFQIAIAAGDPEKFSTGRKTIIYAAVGFLVILLAQGAVSIIRSILGA